MLFHHEDSQAVQQVADRAAQSPVLQDLKT